MYVSFRNGAVHLNKFQLGILLPAGTVQIGALVLDTVKLGNARHGTTRTVQLGTLQLVTVHLGTVKIGRTKYILAFLEQLPLHPLKLPRTTSFVYW